MKSNNIEDNSRYTIALLIDSDNVSGEYFEILLNELQSLGRVTYKRIYGDFTKPKNNGWKEFINKYGISPIQQFAFTTGKNSTDSTMIIDAMDLLYTENVNSFCLATSDSDFTRLAIRLKEDNIFVIGAGEKKTPQSFVRVCDRFLMLDTLYAASSESAIAEKMAAEPEPVKAKTNPANIKKAKVNTEVKAAAQTVELPDKAKIFKTSEEIISGQGGNELMYFSAFMSSLYEKYPQFNYKIYKGKNLKAFFEEHFDFENSPNNSLIIKIRKK